MFRLFLQASKFVCDKCKVFDFTLENIWCFGGGVHPTISKMVGNACLTGCRQLKIEFMNDLIDLLKAKWEGDTRPTLEKQVAMVLIRHALPLCNEASLFMRVICIIAFSFFSFV